MDELRQTLEIRNGEKVAPVFSQGEMDRRLAELRELLAADQLDAVLFTSMHNIHYFSGFLYCSFGRHYGLVVSHDCMQTISANIDAGQPWRRGVCDNLAYTDWQRGNFFRAVRQVVGNIGRLGVEDDHLTVQQRAAMATCCLGAELVDVSGAVMRLRMIKSNEEIGLIRNGAQVADIGGAACVEAAKVEVAEYEIALHAVDVMVKEIAKRYPQSEVRDTWCWFQSGLNTDGAHNPLTTRRLERGDILSLNCFPMIAGYYTALERTLFMDHVSDQHLARWEVNCEVHRRGLELIRPGARCCDIATELNDIYRAHDMLQYRTFGYGHSFGVLSHYYGREAGLELREDIETRLEPGMVVSMEPMIMIPQGQPGAGGYREHDILVLSATGAENITGFPFGPDYNVLKA